MPWILMSYVICRMSCVNYNVVCYISESANDNSHLNVSTDATLNGSDSLRYNTTTGSHSSTATRDLNTNISASMLLCQSESTETNASQEEVDPKSQLANKTIFKTDNPDLSIIEINDNSIKDQDTENSFFLLETLTNDKGDHQKNITKVVGGAKQKISPLTTDDAAITATSDNGRKKAETLIQSRNQTINVAVAETFAAESNATSEDTNDIDDAVPEEIQPVTKREIKIYDTIEEFEENLPSTVTVLDTPFGSRVYLVGTAHFSEESQDDVSYVSRRSNLKGR